ncbi:hypothetical protein [Streptosporangium sp. NPDC000396]|uniref:hypothetical protein n=1 Tax=Streptosporangium sp. NPDC000396 TaxID=3366185 RepID=UPI0036A90E3B
MTDHTPLAPWTVGRLRATLAGLRANTPLAAPARLARPGGVAVVASRTPLRLQAMRLLLHG